MRRTVPAFALLLALVSPFVAWGDESPSAAKPPPEEHDVLFVGGRRMIVMRFEIVVDGRPAHEVWNEFLDRQFQQLDTDGDGTLSRDERQRLPSRRLFEALNLVHTPTGGLGASFLLSLDPRDSATDRDRLGRYFEQIGFRPFRTLTSAPPPRPSVFSSGGVVPNRTPQTGAILFGKLDHNADGAIDPSELEQIAHRLRRSDFDRDESISAGEIAPSTSNMYRAFVADNNARAAAVPDDPFIPLDRSTSRRGRAKRVMALLAAPEMQKRPASQQRLTPSDVDPAARLFEKHDRDGNGEIDFEELVEALDSPVPDLIVTLRYGPRGPGLRPIEFRADGLEQVTVSTAPATVKIAFAGIEITLAPKPASNANPADQLQQMFEQADNDNNGYLDRNESARLGSMRRAFSELDRDDNEQVFADEFQKGLEPVLAAGRQQYQVSVDAGAFDFFRALDTTADSRLTPRELIGLPEQVRAWDRNGDGKVHSGELPQRYELTVGSDPISPARRGVIVQGPRVTPARMTSSIRTLLGTVATPVWFSRMDRNEDGELSPREFLGAETDFQEYDDDGDDLISPAEAIRAGR